MADSHPAVTILHSDDMQPARFSYRKLLRFIGPGLLMSIAYVDPGNLESDLQLGATTGYSLLWMVVYGTLAGYVVQMQAAKLGVATGKHLAEHCREEYQPLPRYLLWLMAEVAIIGSDIQEVIGTAIALALLSGGRLPLWAGVLVTALDSFAFLFIERCGVRVLEGFFAVMIGTMVATFGVMYVRADVPLLEVARGLLVPQLSRSTLKPAVAMVGALIMPHNIYLHSALVQTRRMEAHGEAAKRDALRYFSVESALALAASVLINLCVVCVFARGFFGTPADDIGLENAGTFLGQQYGTTVTYIWALGLLAAGQSSTMAGTYTGQFVMSGYLNWHVSAWRRVCVTRALAIAPTLFVALAYRSHASGLDELNQWLNLLQSVQLPFALLPVLTMNMNSRIVGKFVNSAFNNLMAWGVSALVVCANMGAAVAVADQVLVGQPWWVWCAFAVVVALYTTFVVYLALAGLHAAYAPAAPAGDAGSASGSEPHNGELHKPLLDSAGRDEEAPRCVAHTAGVR